MCKYVQHAMRGPVSLANEGFKVCIIRHSCILCMWSFRSTDFLQQIEDIILIEDSEKAVHDSQQNGFCPFPEAEVCTHVHADIAVIPGTVHGHWPAAHHTATHAD